MLGLNTPSVQVHRFASPELSDAVKRVWRKGIENSEVRSLLLRMVGVGKMEQCADICHEVATDSSGILPDRRFALGALLQLNDPRLQEIATSLETGATEWPQPLARHVMLDWFPEHLPVPRLLNILRQVKEKSDTDGELKFTFPRVVQEADLSPDDLDRLRDGLTTLLVDGATWKRDKFPHLRTKRPDLIAALVAACRRQCIQGIRTEAWVASSLVAVRLSNEAHDHKEAIAELRRALSNLSADMREAAFWKEDAFLAQLRQSNDAWHRVYDLVHYGGIQLNDEKDGGWVRKRLSNTNEPLDRREMMLWAEMVFLNSAAADHRELLQDRLKPLVSDAPRLVSIIEDRLKPPPGAAELRRMEAQHKRRVKQTERRTAKAHASWVMFWRETVQYPDKVFSPGRAQNTAWNLWQAVERSGNESRASGWNRRFIEGQFGKGVADRLRETMMAAWRKDRPTVRSERPDSEKNSFLVRWQFGLAGIAAEAEDPNWAKRVTEEEAELACRYAPLELNGFPSWLERLAIEYPAAVDRVLGEELTLSLRETVDTNVYSMFLQNISYTSALVAALFVPRIRSWLAEVTKANAQPNNPQFEQNLRQGVEILLKSGNDDDRRFLETIAEQRLAEGLTARFAGIWLPVLLYLNPAAGVELLERGLKGSTVSPTGAGAQLFARLFALDPGGLGVNLSEPGFTPRLLLRLVRLAYQHVRIEDDAHHDEGSYTPDMRDNAERGRYAVLSALLGTTGCEGWAVKLEMANDPLFAHFKDRVIALAQEKAAEEADGVAFWEAQFAILDKSGEAPPATNEAMFALLRDRLDDIDDLLLQDVSPRESWANITDEHIMRRELARELRNAANQNYTVDQESATADEKETDIRLRSTVSKQQATIELKLGDNRSAADLLSTIKGQLLTKYMAADECRAGCLLVTIAKYRKWKHPKTGERLDFDALIALMSEEARRLSAELGGGPKLMAKGLDLRPRLATEKRAGMKRC